METQRWGYWRDKGGSVSLDRVVGLGGGVSMDVGAVELKRVFRLGSRVVVQQGVTLQKV